MKELLKAVVFGGLFLTLFIPLLVTDAMFFPYITGKNFAFRIIVEVVFAAWVLLALLHPAYRPRYSWILGGGAALLVVMFFANLFGEFPHKSFWSNFERMEGFVTLVHWFLYLVVLGSVMTTEKLWNRFFHTSLAVAAIVILYAFAQIDGGAGGGWRVDSTFGNSTYMAVYMLFHIFIAALMFARTTSRPLRVMYSLFIAVGIFMVAQTGTRGTTLGLVSGALVTSVLLAIFSRTSRRVRMYATGALAALIVLVGGFIAARDTSFVQENQYLERIASISLAQGQTRFTIWNMALEGVAERPFLGWGQGNFNFVFDANYHPSLYAQEQWFDRVHNIVLDWLIAGGILGALAYFSLFAAAAYYLLVRPLIRNDHSFTPSERSLLLGLLAGYFVHNLFVFDNIVSYLFFGTVLAFLHSKVAIDIPMVQAFRVSKRGVVHIAAPLVAVLLLAVVYVVNVPSIRAAHDIIDALRANTPVRAIEIYERALARNSFGGQEISEQASQLVSRILTSGLSVEHYQEVLPRIEAMLQRQVEEKPYDARSRVFLANFYRAVGAFEPAFEQFSVARTLSPQKQHIIFGQALTMMQMERYDEALGLFREAFLLAPQYERARIFYAAVSLYAGTPEVVDELIVTQEQKRAFALSDIAAQAAYDTRDLARLEELLALRVQHEPHHAQHYRNLSAIQNERGNRQAAIETLRLAQTRIPDFAAEAGRLIDTLRAAQ